MQDRRRGKRNINAVRKHRTETKSDFHLNKEFTPITTPAERFIDCARQFLVEDYLPKIERCLDRLTDEQIWWRANEESNSIGNLVLHLCGNARQWIVCGVGGAPDARDRDAEFAQRDVIERGELFSLLRWTLSDVEATLRKLSSENSPAVENSFASESSFAAENSSVLLEQRTIQGSQVDVLEAIFHVTEHFSMHTGQIIMLTKMLTSSDLRFYDFSTGSPSHGW